MKENKRALVLSLMTGRGTYQETKFEEDAEKVMEFYRDHGYIRAQVGEPEVQGARRLRRQEDALDRAAHSGDRRAALQGRRASTSRATPSSRARRSSRCSSSSRASTTTRSWCAKGSRRRRRSTAPAATWSSPAIPDYKFSDEPNPARRQPRRGAGGRGAGEDRRRRADRRRDAADSGRQAVTSSTASSSPATPRRATTSSAARCGCTRTASSTPRR